MTSYTQRYLNGDHEAVWADLRGLGPVPDDLLEDCTAVAAQTMQRVAAHVARLAARLTDLGLVPSDTLRTPPTAEDQAELNVLVREIGTVPLALEACLRHVGGVWFAGDCPALHLYYTGGDQYGATSGILPDPLVLSDTGYLRHSWDEHRRRIEDDAESADDVADGLADDAADALGEGFVFDFAPDELHKADISGSTHDIPLTHRSGAGEQRPCGADR